MHQQRARRPRQAQAAGLYGSKCLEGDFHQSTVLLLLHGQLLVSLVFAVIGPVLASLREGGYGAGGAEVPGRRGRRQIAALAIAVAVVVGLVVFYF